MKHLFIINPIALASQECVRQTVEKIRSFFANYPDMAYDIHVSRWKRDAVGFTRQYVARSPEIVRVYAIGGNGTLFEVINGVIGLPNVQVAAYPYGHCNSFLSFFGKENLNEFRSLRNLVFSGVIPIDAIRCGNNYGVAAGAIGVEAMANRDATALIDRLGFPSDMLYLFFGFWYILRPGATQRYRISLDGLPLDGGYVSIRVANQPCSGINLNSGADACPYDGLFNVYLTRAPSKPRIFPAMNDYVHGRHERIPEYVTHRSGKALTVESDDVMCIYIDGETFYDARIRCEIIPYALDFVCPESVDAAKSPADFRWPRPIPRKQGGVPA
jgi:diacylglycerol kinase family enzyme